jgi:hypothetical protein
MRRRIWQYWIEAEEITTLAIHGVKNRYPYELTPTQLFNLSAANRFFSID